MKPRELRWGKRDRLSFVFLLTVLYHKTVLCLFGQIDYILGAPNFSVASFINGYCLLSSQFISF